MAKDYSKLHIDPQYKEAWHKALSGPIEIRVDSRSALVRLRYKLYEARKAIEVQEPDLYSSIKALSITERKLSKPLPHEHYLIIKPQDLDIKQSLALALGNEPLIAPDFDP